MKDHPILATFLRWAARISPLPIGVGVFNFWPAIAETISGVLPESWGASLLSVQAAWPAAISMLLTLVIVLSAGNRALRRRLRPKIAIEFVPGDPEFEETTPKNSDGLAKRKYRLRVRNRSAEMVKDCSVKMVKMVDANGTHSQYSGMRFKRRHDNPPAVANMPHEQSFDIAPDDHEDVDIVYLNETEANPRLVMCYALLGYGSIAQVNNAIPVGCCPEILTIRATAANSTPVQTVFKIDVDDSGRLTFETQ